MKFEDWRKYEMSEQTVEHPDHYNWVPGVECIQVVEHFSFNLGNAIKYIWRSGRKPDVSAINDFEKAKYYLDLEIARIKDERMRQWDELREQQDRDDFSISGSCVVYTTSKSGDDCMDDFYNYANYGVAPSIMAKLSEEDIEKNIEALRKVGFNIPDYPK